jgi:probable HAF family extracellular repeat protein
MPKMLVVALLFLALQSPLLAQTVTYSITDLGPLSHRTADSAVWSVNDTGLAALALPSSDITIQAHSWDKTNGARAMVMPSGAVSSVGRAINFSGDVAGWVSTGYNEDKAFVWKASGEAFALSLPGARSRAYGINDNGQVVGEYSGTAGTRAFFYDARTGFVDLGLLPGTSACTATGINLFQEVIGYCSDPIDGDPFQAFVWSQAAGIRPLLPRFKGMSMAYGFNNSGQAVGMARDRSSSLAFVTVVATGKTRYFELAIGSTATRYSIAFSTNDAGQTVGESSARAFIDNDGVTSDLNTVIPSDSGWVLSSAFSVNAAGQIVGTGSLNGERHGYMLTPEFTLEMQKPRGNAKR